VKRVTRFIGVAWIPGILLVPLTAFATDVALSPAQLPEWKAPPAYSVDVVMVAQGDTISMKRYIDAGRIRSQISTDGHTTIMIEPGGAKRVMYSLVPDQKVAIERTVPEGMLAADSAAAKPEVISLGSVKVDGVLTRHYRILTASDVVDAWFDARTSAPVRMASGPDSARTTIEWKNLAVGPQPAGLFEVPADYHTVDMDAMLAQARGMMTGAGIGSQATVVGGVVGIPDESALGKDLGESFGGVLGNTATPYLDGQIGSWVGGKDYTQ
jgi:hypothetical protein